jgi:DNA-binding IclR family transcriptional regulator
MKSLDKAFDIMELVASLGGESITPGKAAEKLGINSATCVRFMKYLCRRGYLEQISRKAGYVAGPACLTFADRQSQYSKIIDASEEPLMKLAHALGNYINVSVLYNNKRYLLYSYSSLTRKLSGARRLKFNYEAATSRLLLSACSAAERDELIEVAGMPGKSWDNIDDKDELLTALEQVRKDICISFIEPFTGQVIVGGLISAEGYPPAAIGFGIAGDDPAEALELTAETVRQIEQNLKHKEIYF